VERVVDILATVALGAYKETDLRAVRVAAPDLVVGMYLQGA
jgi:hypothetical protein